MCVNIADAAHPVCVLILLMLLSQCVCVNIADAAQDCLFTIMCPSIVCFSEATLLTSLSLFRGFAAPYFLFYAHLWCYSFTQPLLLLFWVHSSIHFDCRMGPHESEVPPAPSISGAVFLSALAAEGLS